MQSYIQTQFDVMLTKQIVRYKQGKQEFVP